MSSKQSSMMHTVNKMQSCSKNIKNHTAIIKLQVCRNTDIKQYKTTSRRFI